MFLSDTSLFYKGYLYGFLSTRFFQIMVVIIDRQYFQKKLASVF